MNARATSLATSSATGASSCSPPVTARLSFFALATMALKTPLEPRLSFSSAIRSTLTRRSGCRGLAKDHRARRRWRRRPQEVVDRGERVERVIARVPDRDTERDDLAGLHVAGGREPAGGAA